jgi:NitT/TauT family transport system substrate-binding protein
MRRKHFSTRSRVVSRVTAAVIVLPVLLLACGDSDGSSNSAPTTPLVTTGKPTVTTEAAPATTAPPPKPTTTTIVTVAATGPGTPKPQPLAKRGQVVVAVPALGEFTAGLLLGQKFGEFDKENLDVKVSTLPGPDALAALIAGKIDAIAGQNVSPAFMNAIASGADVRLAGRLSGPVLTETGGSAWFARNKFIGPDGKLDACRLKGATVFTGSPAGLSNAGTLRLLELLQGCNLTLQDIVVGPVGSAPDALIALQQGSVDVALLGPPFSTQVSPDVATRVATHDDRFFGGIQLGESRHDNQAAIEAFLRGLARTNRTYLQGNFLSDPTTKSAIADALGLDLAKMPATATTVFPTDHAITDKQKAMIEAVQQMWLNTGGILKYDHPLALADIADTSLVEKALG